jgi:hypothetical protein
MKKEVEKKEYRIGDVAGHADKALCDRFERFAKLRAECYQILIECAAQDRSTWDDALKEYSLSKDFQYKINRPSGEIIVIGYDWKNNN